jgi:hypothetical protein
MPVSPRWPSGNVVPADHRKCSHLFHAHERITRKRRCTTIDGLLERIRGPIDERGKLPAPALAPYELAA